MTKNRIAFSTIAFSLSSLFVFISCAVGTKNNLNGVSARGIMPYLGTLVVENQQGQKTTCAATYMGVMRGAPYAITASHCVEPLVNAGYRGGVLWDIDGGRSPSTIADVSAATGPTKRIGDVALLRLHAIPDGTVRPFDQSYVGRSMPSGSYPSVQQFRTSAHIPNEMRIVTILAPAANQTLNGFVQCSITNVSAADGGFLVAGCSDERDVFLTPQISPGLSGALVVDAEGKPIGVFKGSPSAMGTGSFAFSVSALIWNAETAPFFGVPDAVVYSGGDNRIPFFLCKQSLLQSCGSYSANDTQLLQCASDWINRSDVLGGNGNQINNGAICQVGTPDNPLFQQNVRAILTNNNRGGDTGAGAW